jgi:hypothetical protein
MYWRRGTKAESAAPIWRNAIPERPPGGVGPYYRRCAHCAVHDAAGKKDDHTVDLFPYRQSVQLSLARVSESLRVGGCTSGSDRVATNCMAR